MNVKEAGDRAGDVALWCVGRGELESDRGAVGGAEQIEPKTPEVARMRAAVAVAGIATELRPAGSFARLSAGDRGRVKQPQSVAERRRDVGQVVDAAPDLRRERPDALVVAGLLRQVGEQVAEAPAREAVEAAVVATVEEDLGDGQRDDLGVGELWPPTGTGSLEQEIVSPH